MLAAMLFIAPAAHAEPIGCTAGALVGAIGAANAAGTATVELAPGCRYTLTAVDNTPDEQGPNGLPAITADVTILGNGATLLRDPDPATPGFRFFYVLAGASLTLDGVALDGGSAPIGLGGGAILTQCGGDGAELEIRRTTFRGNTAASEGGAIFTCANFAVDDSLFVANRARIGGAVSSTSHGEVRNSTFVGNVATEAAAAVSVDADRTFRLRHATIAGNTTEAPGGAVRGAILENAILASNVPANCAGPIDAQGPNLAFPAADASCANAEVSGPAEYVAADPRLEPLGATGLLAPALRSPAVDAAGAAACLPADARGVARPAGLGCDLGAIELEPLAPVCGDAASSGAFGAVQRLILPCSDPNGYPLAFSVVAAPTSGALGPFAGGAVDYAPTAGFSGGDAFVFRADNGTKSATGTARLAVGSPAAERDVVAPVVLRVAVSPRRVRRAATLAFTLSEPAAATLTIAQRRAGVRLRRAGRTGCVAASARNRRAARRQVVARLGADATRRDVRQALRRAACHVFVRRDVLRHAGVTGANRVALTAAQRARLRPGAYRLTVEAVDAAGNRSAPRRASFTIVGRG